MPYSYFCRGELAEWSNAAVLKTVDCHRSGGSNPSLSAKYNTLKITSFVARPLEGDIKS